MKKVRLIAVALFSIAIMTQLSIAEARWVMCEFCYGTGDCQECDGRGWIEVWNNDLWDTELIRCGECHGTGDCWFCYGEGRVRE